MTNNLILDNTMIKSFNRCPRQFQYRHIMHLTPINENSTPLFFGSVVHSALENYYLTGDIDKSLQLAKDLYTPKVIQPPQGIDIGLNPIGSYPSVSTIPTDDTRNITSCLTILGGYFKKWHPEQFKIKQVEVAFQIELASDLIFCGKADGVIEYLGDLYILEHKTSKSISSFCAKPNHQISGYIYSLRVLGQPIVGAIVNLIAVLKTKLDYHRVITTRVESELEEWRMMVLDVKTRIDRCLSRNWFPKDDNSCSFCSFKTLCNTENKDIAETIIQTQYKSSPWRPWESKKEVVV